MAVWYHCHHSYLWTSQSSLLFVICHVNPLATGSKPGCEISKSCFFTSFIYLKSGNYLDNYTAIEISASCFCRNSLLFRFKMLHPKVFIPDKYVLVSGNNIRMKESFCEPPSISSILFSICVDYSVRITKETAKENFFTHLTKFPTILSAFAHLYG